MKEYIDEYTMTMDIKAHEEIPRLNLSISNRLNPRKGHQMLRQMTLTRSDGECNINQAGGVEQLGTYGDVTKGEVEPVAVRCGLIGKVSKGAAEDVGWH
jgi:hypothetical protein